MTAVATTIRWVAAALALALAATGMAQDSAAVQRGKAKFEHS